MATARGKQPEKPDVEVLTVWQKAKQLLWGLFLFDYWKEIVSIQKKYEDAINLVLLGEILGLPFMQSVFTLRLLPYLFRDIQPWKFRTLREVDIFEAAPDLH
jgi:hypothetical protein